MNEPWMQPAASRVMTDEECASWNPHDGGPALNPPNGFDPHSPQSRKLQVVRLNTVEPKAINWMWQNRFAFNKVTLLAGDPGWGKSTVTRSIAASVTRGWRWPDGAPACEPGNVVMLAAEDGIADTLVPGLMKVDADLSKIFAVQGVEYSNPDIAKRVFNLRSDTPQLLETIETITNVKLLIVDPVSSYLDGVDSNKNGDVRSTLQPLVEAAEDRGFAVLLVTHLSKQAARSALSAATGSLAFGALARQAHLILPDPDDSTGQRRLFLCMKSNICRRPSGLAFEIGDGGAIQWCANPVNLDADDVLRRSNQGQPKPKKADVAKDFLEALDLHTRPLPAAEIQSLAAEKDISVTTLRRAFSDLGGTTNRDGFQGHVMWQLPNPETDDSHTNQSF